MSSEPERTGIEFEVEVDGVRHAGWYFVSGDSVTVMTLKGEGTASVDEGTPGTVARTLLRKLIRDGLG